MKTSSQSCIMFDDALMYRSIPSAINGRNHLNPRSPSPVGFSGLSSLEYGEGDDVVWRSIGDERRCLVDRAICLYSSEIAFLSLRIFQYWCFCLCLWKCQSGPFNLIDPFLRVGLYKNGKRNLVKYPKTLMVFVSHTQFLYLCPPYLEI